MSVKMWESGNQSIYTLPAVSGNAEWCCCIEKSMEESQKL